MAIGTVLIFVLNLFSSIFRNFVPKIYFITACSGPCLLSFRGRDVRICYRDFLIVSYVTVDRELIELTEGNPSISGDNRIDQSRCCRSSGNRSILGIRANRMSRGCYCSIVCMTSVKMRSLI